MSDILICKKCHGRASGEAWHGPHCQCHPPDFVRVDTRFPIVPQLKGWKVGLVPPKEKEKA